MRRALLVIAAALGLAACEAETRGVQMIAAPIGPGDEIAPDAVVMDLFDRVCLRTGARVSDARQVLAGLPVRENPETGTHFHQTYNLSFNPARRDGRDLCSIVTYTADPAKLGSRLAAIAQSKGLEARIRPSDDGYLNVVVR